MLTATLIRVRSSVVRSAGVRMSTISKAVAISATASSIASRVYGAPDAGRSLPSVTPTSSSMPRFTYSVKFSTTGDRRMVFSNTPPSTGWSRPARSCITGVVYASL